MDLTRRSVVKGAVTTLAASTTAHSSGWQDGISSTEPQPFFIRLVKSSNQPVARMLEQPGRVSLRASGRGVGRGGTVMALAVAYCAPESSYFQSSALIPLLENAAKIFVDAQNKDGTLDAGNLASPPDTAFVVEGLATALAVLRRANDPRLATAEHTLTKFLLAAGEALVTGGVHTPNHRWVICSGLARINSLFPTAKYVNRIDDWLGEGIYIDSDGQFEERSTGIYSRVTGQRVCYDGALARPSGASRSGTQKPRYDLVLSAPRWRGRKCRISAAGSEHGHFYIELLSAVSISSYSRQESCIRRRCEIHRIEARGRVSGRRQPRDLFHGRSAAQEISS